MPTKERREREARQKAERRDILDKIPAHIKARIEARKLGGKEASMVLTNILGGDPPYLKMKGGLLVIDTDGSAGILAKGDPMGSANDVRADARNQNIQSLKKAYPQYWEKRGGAEAIALTEAELPSQDRAIKPSKGQPGPVSLRTVQDYFRKIRRARRVP